MKLDRTFAKEIVKTANGDGTREARFVFLRSAKSAAKELSTPTVAKVFNEAVKTYGRATVAVCVAATVMERQNRLERSTVLWAQEVMRLWTNCPYDRGCVAIRDGLHPTRIEEYAGPLIRITSETSL